MKKSGSNTQIQAINKQSSSRHTNIHYKQTTTTTIAKHTNKNKTLLIHKSGELSSNNGKLGFGERSSGPFATCNCVKRINPQ